MRKVIISLMLTLTAFIANAQPSAIAPRDYQQMLKKGIDVDWWGRSEKNKYGDYSETAVKRFAQQGIRHVRFRLHHYRFTDEDFKRLFSQINTCMQYGKYGVRVNCVAPGPTNTSMFPQEFKEVFSQNSPLGRIVEPEEIAKAVFFMATDASSAITGETIPVTAGFEISTGQPRMID